MKMKYMIINGWTHKILRYFTKFNILLHNLYGDSEATEQLRYGSTWKMWFVRN